MKNKIIPGPLRRKVEKVCRDFLKNKPDLEGEACFIGEQTILRIKVRTCFRELTDVNEIEIDALGHEICKRCGLLIHRVDTAGPTLRVLDFKIAA